MQMREAARSGRTQAERSAATMERLHTSARRLFAEKGYVGTSLSDIVADAGLTKGAVYHHFVSKEEVFREVYEREQRTLVQAVRAAAACENDPWDGFIAGWRAFLDASLEPSVQRITLVEAPVALGWDVVRAIGSSHTLGLVERGLQRAMEAGRITECPVGPLSRMLFTAMCEGSMIISRAADQEESRRRVSEAADALFAGLQVRPAAS